MVKSMIIVSVSSVKSKVFIMDIDVRFVFAIPAIHRDHKRVI